MIGVSLLSRWEPDRLHLAARELDESVDQLRLAVSVLENGPQRSVWSGRAADYARRQSDDLGHQMLGLRRACATAADALRRGARELDAARGELAVARSLAAAAGWSVGEDGSVHPPSPPALPGDPPPGAAERASAALVAARRCDRTLALAIDEALLRAVMPDSASISPWVAGPAPGPSRLTRAPLLVDPGSWWEVLPWAERARLLADQPAWLGRTDGLPLAVRDTANRLVLHRALHGELPGDRRLRLLAVQHAVQPAGRSLLMVDTSGDRAVIGIGDLDRAAHVAVLVPGMGTDVVGDLGRLSADAARVQAQAQRQVDAEHPVAAIAWLGYVTPTLTSVASMQRAEVGAAQLDGFLRGLRSSRTRKAHITLVGHSYGSLTAGLAVAAGSPVDDLVLIGSPGVGVLRARDLGLLPTRVHVGEARGDVVADLAQFGTDPSVGGFGADRLATGTSSDPSSGQALRSSHGHSDYYSPGTTSLHGIASVVAGQRR